MDFREPDQYQSGVDVDEPIQATMVEPPSAAHAQWHVPRRPRVLIPVLLFLATCTSTFLVGSGIMGPPLTRDVSIAAGTVYMLAVMGILFTHEMGHFLQALRYRVPASLPFFIPLPLWPIGTMGAVIGMPGTHADRRQMFDIGISGPLAGLAVAIPITWVGILQAPIAPALADSTNAIHFSDPLLFKLLIALLRPDVPPGGELLLTPLLWAGWVGMLITGLNMMPVSQLDGGHVAYALFGRRAHWLARTVLLSSIAAVVILGLYSWMLMILLVTFIGTDHPPTRNDSMPLGKIRTAVGLLSLAIPILCLTPQPLIMPY